MGDFKKSFSLQHFIIFSFIALSFFSLNVTNVTAVVLPVSPGITIGPIDPGATLTVNGAPALENDLFPLSAGDTVTFLTTFGGKTYEDVIEYHYDINVAVHAVDYGAAAPGGTIYLDTNPDFGYTPYDIYIITGTSTSWFNFDMSSPPGNDAVKIIGFHVMVPWADIYALGDTSHTGTPRHIAEVFYGTVESNGHLHLGATCSWKAGSSFNKIVGKSVVFDNSCSDDQDVMIQELYADYAESDDTEISWWRMELTDEFYVDDYDGYSLNDELPELDSLNDDPMLWFKARNPAKWALYPLIKIDGTGDSWDFDNYDYKDYNFWEIQLTNGDFYWYNNDDYNEYAHFLGPVIDVDDFEWTYYNDYLYINFFGDDYNEYYDSDRFDGDRGSAGYDFWNPLLTTPAPNGYGYTSGSIISPIFLLKLRGGDFYTEDYDDSYETELYLADNQDLLIASDESFIDFDCYYDCYFYEGINSHWVVEDGLNYWGETPTDDAFNITIVSFTQSGSQVSVVATNDYRSGDDTDSTMYIAHRLKTDYGKQFTKTPMTYNSGTGRWSAAVNITDEGEYYFFTVATENDDVYGKLVEHFVSYTPLAKTGQSTSYRAGDDGDLQAGAAWPTPRFTDNNDGTITDNLTELTWLADANCIQSSYPGFDADGKVDWLNALTFVNGINSGTYSDCGANRYDWRLPNISEIESLAHAEQETASWLNSEGFSNAAASLYWSSTTFAINTADAWAMNMRKGAPYKKPKTGHYYLLPVRGASTGPAPVAKTGQTGWYGSNDDGDLEKGVAWSSPRFQDNGDNTMTDNLTRLMWTRSANTPGPRACFGGQKLYWHNTYVYLDCLNNYNYLGHNDWRMANRKEMRSLINYGQADNRTWLTGEGFKKTKWGYWTSTAYFKDTRKAWNINIKTGRFADKWRWNLWNGDKFFIWPVRGGRTE